MPIDSPASEFQLRPQWGTYSRHSGAHRVTRTLGPAASSEGNMIVTGTLVTYPHRRSNCKRYFAAASITAVAIVDEINTEMFSGMPPLQMVKAVVGTTEGEDATEELFPAFRKKIFVKSSTEPTKREPTYIN